MSTHAETLVPGTIVADRYRVESFLGEGLPGGVYLATQEALRRQVTLKVLERNPDDPRARPRFEREAEALSRLSHPSCAEVFDYGEWQGLHYLVLRHVEGQLLSRSLRKQIAVPVLEALTLAIDLADGLAHAHAAGVVHRNLSPDRVVLSEERETRQHAILVDFGLAHIGRVELDTTAGHSPLGSPGYLAPERVRGEPGEAPCDVFALGVILYEMLTGEMPFTRGSPAETLVAVTQHRVPPLDRAHPEVITTPALTRALQVATEPRPEDRFRDGRELRQALRAARASLIHPSLSRASFSVTDGVCHLDEPLQAHIDEPTPPLAPQRDQFAHLVEPAPEEEITLAQRAAPALSIAALAIVAGVVLVATAGCAIAVGLQVASALAR